jgi:fluoroacetyl-CoA thioesterase
MASIPVGTRGELTRRVTAEVAVDFLGLEGARVLGTPFLIMLLEMTARDAVLPLLDPGFDTVGTEVNIKHLAATPLGMETTYRAEVVECDGRRIRFNVEAFDEKEQIARGTHERFVIHVERFAERLAAKRG